MKRRLNILVCMMIVAAASPAAVSCIRGGECPVSRTEEVKVNFRIRTPRPVPIATRAVDEEYAVRSLDMLVFVREGGEYIYKYRAEADFISQSDNSEAIFEAKLYVTGRKVKLLAIANCPPGKLNGLGGTGMVTETEVRDGLVGNMAEADPRVGNFVMTGDAELTGGISNAQGSIRIPLMRAVAKIEIEKAQTVDNFDIRSITVYRSADLSQYFPDVEAIVSGAPVVKVASVPDEVDYNSIEPGTTNFADGLDGVFTTYMNENDANDIVREETCIVVGGYFGGDKSKQTYYRMGFDTEAGAPTVNPKGQVLRNYVYQFTIRSVAGPGWNTPDDAANHYASQMAASVVPWSGAGGDSEYHFGGDRYVILSDNRLMLDAAIDYTDEMYITTSALPFTITSERDPAVGKLDTADPERTLGTDLMTFSLTNIGGVQPGQQRWRLAATALTNDKAGDNLRLEALGGLVNLNIPVRRVGDFSVNRTSELVNVPTTGTRDKTGNYTNYVEYEVIIPEATTWSASITDDWRGYLIDDAGQPVSALSGQAADARLRVGFDKLYYPTVGESPRVTIEVGVDGRPDMSKTIVVAQDMLPSFTGTLKIIDMYPGWGSVYSVSYIARYTEYLKSVRMYGPGGFVRTPGLIAITGIAADAAAIPTAIDPSFRYVHAAGNPTNGYTQQRHDVINNYWKKYGNDRLFLYAVEQRTNSVFNNSTENNDKRTTVLSTLGVDYLSPTGGGYQAKITTAPEAQRTAVFRYLTQDGPFGRADDFADHVYQYDGNSSGVDRASLPSTAVPIMFDNKGVEGGCVMMFIDPANGVVYWGDSQLVDTGQPTFRTAEQMFNGNRDGHSIFLANLVAYIVNCAQHGSSFADLFVPVGAGNYPLYELAFPSP